MTTREESDLENMAMASELARQLCHDFSNFLYNFFLQIEIVATTGKSSNQENWQSIKQDGEKVSRRIQEWARYNDRFLYTESAIDLHKVIRAVAHELSSQRRTVQLAPEITAVPLVIVCSPVDCKHLLRLLVEDLFDTAAGSAEPTQGVTVQTATVDQKAVVRITGGENSEFVEVSLLAAACRSLAVRLGAAIRRERAADGVSVLLVEFPVSQ